MGEKRQPLAFLFPPGPRCQSLGLSRGFLVALLVAFSWRFSGGGPIRLARGEQRASSIEHGAASSEHREGPGKRQLRGAGMHYHTARYSGHRRILLFVHWPTLTSALALLASWGEGRSAASRHLGISAAGGGENGG